MKKWPLSAILMMMATVASANDDSLASAQNSGSVRLANFAATTAMERNSSPQAMSLFLKSSAELGFNVLDPVAYKRTIRDVYFGVRPVFFYDANANGGNPSDRLVLGPGAVIVFAPETVAQSGVFVGPKVGAGAKLTYGRGRYLDAGVNLSVARDVAGHFTQTKGSAQVCSRNHLVSWTFLDLCTSANLDKKKLGESSSRRSEIEIGQMDNLFTYPTEFKLGLYQFDSGDKSYPGLSTSILTALQNGYSVRLGYENGFLNEGEAGTENLFSLGVNLPFRGRTVQISLSQSQSVERPILGKDRHEEVTSVNLTAPVTARFSVSLGFSKTSSSIDFYTKNSFSLSIISARF